MKIITEIQILSHRVATAVASLGSVTAILLSADIDTELVRSFLVKKVMAQFFIDGSVVDEAVLIGMARGGTSITQIKTALETIQTDRDDSKNALTKEVLMETVRIIGAGLSDGSGNLVINYEVSLGGGKGIPFAATEGWTWFAYNPAGGPLSAGSQVVVGHVSYSGIWL